MMKWYNEIESRPRSEKERERISVEVQVINTPRIPGFAIKPGGGGEGSGESVPVVCEGDFEGDYSGPDEEFIDVIASLPYDITVVWMEVNGTAGFGNMALGAGPEGSGFTAIDFAGEGPLITQTESVVRHMCNQPVPALGYLQLGTGDWFDSDTGDGSVHYKIHYTYRCADAP